MDSRLQPTGMMMARPKEERALDLFRRLAVKWKRRKIHRHVTKVSPVANSRPTLKGDFRPGWNSAALPWWSPCILLLLLCTARASACEGNICRSIWMRASSHSPSTALLGPKHYLPKSRTVYLKTSSQLRPAPFSLFVKSSISVWKSRAPLLYTAPINSRKVASSPRHGCPVRLFD